MNGQTTSIAITSPAAWSRAPQEIEKNENPSRKPGPRLWPLCTGQRWQLDEALSAARRAQGDLAVTPRAPHDDMLLATELSAAPPELGELLSREEASHCEGQGRSLPAPDSSLPNTAAGNCLRTRWEHGDSVPQAYEIDCARARWWCCDQPLWNLPNWRPRAGNRPPLAYGNRGVGSPPMVTPASSRGVTEHIQPSGIIPNGLSKLVMAQGPRKIVKTAVKSPCS